MSGKLSERRVIVHQCIIGKQRGCSTHGVSNKLFPMVIYPHHLRGATPGATDLKSILRLKLQGEQILSHFWPFNRVLVSC